MMSNALEICSSNDLESIMGDSLLVSSSKNYCALGQRCFVNVVYNISPGEYVCSASIVCRERLPGPGEN